MCETRNDSTGYSYALSIWTKTLVPFFRENLISDDCDVQVRSTVIEGNSFL